LIKGKVFELRLNMKNIDQFTINFESKLLRQIPNASKTESG